MKLDFLKTNGYQNWVFNQIYQKVIESRKTRSKKLNSTKDRTTEDFVLNNTKKVHIISLPYKGGMRQNIMKSLNNTLSNVLPDRHVTKIVHTGKN